MRALLSRCIIAAFVVCLLGPIGAPTTGRADAPLPAAREGCMSQWMFNGIWRVRVSKVDPLMDDGGKQIGWLVTEQWRNGTKRTFAPGDTFAKDQTLVLSNGAVITAIESTNGTLSSQDLLYHQFPAAAQYTHEQKFIATGTFDASVKPAAVVISFDAARQAAHKEFPQYSVSPAAYKIKLDCTATAGQQAQGGSYEIPAQEGCVNQWLANGLWKVRVTKVDAENDAGNQVGWQVAQDWLNISGRKIAPGNAWLGDEQLVLSNGDTVSSSNTTITTLKARNSWGIRRIPANRFRTCRTSGISGRPSIRRTSRSGCSSCSMTALTSISSVSRCRSTRRTSASVSNARNKSAVRILPSCARPTTSALHLRGEGVEGRAGARV